jgi:hypothetical protein
MRYTAAGLWMIILMLLCGNAAALKIHNRQYKFKITIPGKMAEVKDSSLTESRLFYDTTAQIILVISERQSQFNSVKEYLDCAQKDLEQLLKFEYGDRSLELTSCRNSPYYPAKATVLQFRVSVLPFGFDTYVIYFIHHKGKDLQFAFTCKKEQAKDNMNYIDGIMSTLKLK